VPSNVFETAPFLANTPRFGCTQNITFFVSIVLVIINNIFVVLIIVVIFPHTTHPWPVPKMQTRRILTLGRRLYKHLSGGPCLLSTSSRSTIVRTTLLLSGFYVGKGTPVRRHFDALEKWCLRQRHHCGGCKRSFFRRLATLNEWLSLGNGLVFWSIISEQDHVLTMAFVEAP
jgi:hypothetical protein